MVAKALKVKKEGGLIVMLPMEKVATNLVVGHREKKEQNTQHAALLLEHVKRKVEVSLGVKKPREVKNNEN